MKQLTIAFLHFLLILTAMHCTAQPAEKAPAKNASPAPAASSVAQPDTTADPDLRRYNALVEMLFDVKMTHAERAQLRTFADGYRFSDDAQKNQVFKNCLVFYEQLMGMSASERDAQCKKLRAITLNEHWKIAKTGDTEAKWMLDLYYAAHPPLASGTPPLTREIVDALIEFDYFFNVEVKGIKAEPMDAAFREKMYKEAIAKWKTLNVAQQQEMFTTAANVALQRLQWEHSTPEQRLFVKAKVVGENNLSEEERRYLAQFRQAQAAQLNQLRQQQTQLITNELQFMRQNQQTIMGNGTYYNQTLGRWEQHGGIVTEFH